MLVIPFPLYHLPETGRKAVFSTCEESIRGWKCCCTDRLRYGTDTCGNDWIGELYTPIAQATARRTRSPSRFIFSVVDKEKRSMAQWALASFFVDKLSMTWKKMHNLYRWYVWESRPLKSCFIVIVTLVAYKNQYPQCLWYPYNFWHVYGWIFSVAENIGASSQDECGPQWHELIWPWALNAKNFVGW